MNNYVETIYQKLLHEIEAVPELKNVNVKNPLLTGDLVRKCIEELKAHFKENPFTDPSGEINFFKYEKPAIIAEHIFAQELYAIESNKPIGDKSLTDNFYTQELIYIRRVFDQNRYLYQYFQLDGTEFDKIYFSRGSRRPEVNLPAAPDADPDFSTPGDFVYARFIAYERLQNHFSNILYSDQGMAEGKNNEPIRWTGDVINLVELIYGLHLTGQINHGNASMNELVRWAELQFGVKIGVIQRKFAEIQRRKRMTATKFIEQMRDSLQHKIDDLSA
jgi:hypothetical protein